MLQNQKLQQYDLYVHVVPSINNLTNLCIYLMDQHQQRKPKSTVMNFYSLGTAQQKILDFSIR